MNNKILVTKIINIWDPLGVYGLGPDDEYKDIVEEIIKSFSNSSRDKIKEYLSGLYCKKTDINDKKLNELYALLSMIIKS